MLLLSERVLSYHVRDAQNQPLPPEKWPITRLLRGETLGGKDDATIRVDLPDGRDMLVTYTGAPIRTEDEESLAMSRWVAMSLRSGRHKKRCGARMTSLSSEWLSARMS